MLGDYVGRSELTEADFQAADAVIARIEQSASGPAPNCKDLRNSLASLHVRFGADKFALRYGLREPRSPAEELEASFFGQQITLDEYKKRLKEYATRPLDLAMLQKFFSEHEAAVSEYSAVLQLVVEIATDQHEPECWETRECEVDDAVAQLDAKFDLFSTELMTVSEFLTRVQLDRTEPIKLCDFTGDSAHWIASLVWSNTSKAWQRCKDIAQRSREDSGYLYSTNASALFFKTWIEPGKLPKPNDLGVLLRIERTKALANFHVSIKRSGPSSVDVARTVQPVHFDDFSGHQFERLVFAYHLRTRKWRTLEWYGQSGSDGGRDIWGETESDGTLCIQCANWKEITSKKITDDLDKIVNDRRESPDAVLVVCGSKVSAKLRDKVKEHARSKGITRCNIWSGQEFEERLRQHTESLLRRFVQGEKFPEDPESLRLFAGE